MNHCIVDFWLHLKDQENNELQAQWGTAHMPRKQNRMVLGSIQASHLSYFLSAFLKPEKFTCEKLLKHRPLHCTDLHCNTLEALRLTIHLHPADYTLRGELEVANVGSKLLIPVRKPWEKEGRQPKQDSQVPPWERPSAQILGLIAALSILQGCHGSADGSAELCHVASHWQSLSNASSCCFVAACHEATDFTRPKDAKKIQKDQKLTWKGSISNVFLISWKVISTAFPPLLTNSESCRPFKNRGERELVPPPRGQTCWRDSAHQLATDRARVARWQSRGSQLSGAKQKNIGFKTV